MKRMKTLCAALAMLLALGGCLAGAPAIMAAIPTASYCLPNSGYLSYIRDAGAAYYITAGNRDSHVTMTSDGKKLKVKTAN